MHRRPLLRRRARLRVPVLSGGNLPSRSSPTDRVIRSVQAHSLNCGSRFPPRARNLGNQIPQQKYLRTQTARQLMMVSPASRKQNRKQWKQGGRTTKVHSSITQLKERHIMVHSRRRGN